MLLVIGGDIPELVEPQVSSFGNDVEPSLAQVSRSPSVRSVEGLECLGVDDIAEP